MAKGRMSGMNMLRAGVISLVFIAIISAAGAIALDDFNDDLTAGSTADNITQDGLTGISNATGFFTTIGTLLGVAALVAIVVGAFSFFRR